MAHRIINSAYIYFWPPPWGLFLRVRAKKLIFISGILTVLFMQIQGNVCGWF